MPCHAEKEFLALHNVPFTEKDVTKDRSLLQELVALKSRATPTTIVDGEVVIGFDRAHLRRLLGL